MVDIETLLKANYMLYGLKPDDNSKYVRVVETGEILNTFTDDIDESIKIEPISQKDIFMIMLTNYTFKILKELEDMYFMNSVCEDDTFIRNNVRLFKTDSDFTSSGNILDIALNLKKFCEEDEDVKTYLTSDTKSKYEIFNNVSCLILFYGIRKKRNLIIENWCYSQNELKELLHIMNISEDNYEC